MPKRLTRRERSRADLRVSWPSWVAIVVSNWKLCTISRSWSKLKWVTGSPAATVNRSAWVTIAPLPPWLLEAAEADATVGCMGCISCRPGGGERSSCSEPGPCLTEPDPREPVAVSRGTETIPPPGRAICIQGYEGPLGGNGGSSPPLSELSTLSST